MIDISAKCTSFSGGQDDTCPFPNIQKLVNSGYTIVKKETEDQNVDFPLRMHAWILSVYIKLFYEFKGGYPSFVPKSIITLTPGVYLKHELGTGVPLGLLIPTL